MVSKSSTFFRRGSSVLRLPKPGRPTGLKEEALMRSTPRSARAGFVRRPGRPGRRSTAAVASAALAFSLLPLLPARTAHAEVPAVTVSPASAVTLVREGEMARVTLRVTTADGKPLASPVTVSYATGTGTATRGRDYTPVEGTVTLPAGTESGSTRSFTVATARDRAAEQAETVPVTFTTSTVVTGTATVVVNANGLPYLDPDRSVARRVSDLLGRMTLADKVGQMTQAERANVYDDPTQIATLRLGSVLSGGGSTPPQNTPTAWTDMVDDFQRQALSTPLQIPMIYGIDSVHGNGNLYGATVFPHNIGLGATRDPALVRAAAHITAAETRAIGIPWTFAPCLCVVRDDRWGRTYESFGESPDLAQIMGNAAIAGFQGRRASRLDESDRVLATAKHFAGDGHTTYGTGEGGGEFTIDQGTTIVSRAEFERVDLAPFAAAVKRQKVGSIMPSYSSVDFTDDGVGNPVKMHQNAQLLTGWLKEKQGFDGFLIGDYDAIHHLTGNGHAVQVRNAINAGLDMAMEPNDYKTFITDLTGQVERGFVPRSRIDDAVRRILTKKFQLGLFEQPFAPRELIADIGSDEHRAVARRAAAESQVLLKNSGGLLPLSRNAKVYVAGRNADDIGNQAGGWTLQWQGVNGADVIPGTSVLEGMRQVAPDAQITYSADGSAPAGDSDVGVVVVGETPYAEGYGDVGGPEWPFGTPQQREEEKSLELTAGDRAVVDRVCGAVEKCVVLVVSGRPQIVTPQLGEIDALVASWLPGSEGAGVADVLFGRRGFTGTLPVSWPRTAAQEPVNVGDRTYDPLFRYGFGLTTGRTR
jgi:beta-glucosidase